MNKEEVKQMEYKAELYFRYIIECESMRSKITSLRKQIEEINSDINIISNNMEIFEKTKDKNDGYVYDDELVKNFEVLKKEQQYKSNMLIKTKRELREREWYVKEFEYITSCLDECERNFMNLKYNKKKKMSTISVELGVGLSTLYRKKKNITMVINNYFKDKNKIIYA